MLDPKKRMYHAPLFHCTLGFEQEPWDKQNSQAQDHL